MDDIMETRHFYKHNVTGVVAALNDDFAGAFGDDVFTRVDSDTIPDPDVQLNAEVPADEIAAESEPDPADVPADPAAVNPDNATDTSKDGNN